MSVGEPFMSGQAQLPRTEPGTEMTVDWRTFTWCDPATTDAISVNARSASALLDDLGRRFDRGEGFSVATLNLDHVVKIRRLPAFRAAYAAHSHITADGNPIVWLLRLAGRPVQLTPGSELVDPATALMAAKGVPLALFGSTESSLEAAAEVLKERHPGLVVTACIAPPMGFDPESAAADELIDRLAASGARAAFLARGAPKQEVLAARIAKAYPHIGLFSVGAGLDFLSGTQVRAPALARALAVEWLWRLVSSPRRMWRRYGECLVILPGLALSALRLRLSRQTVAR